MSSRFIISCSSDKASFSLLLQNVCWWRTISFDQIMNTSSLDYTSSINTKHQTLLWPLTFQSRLKKCCSHKISTESEKITWYISEHSCVCRRFLNCKLELEHQCMGLGVTIYRIPASRMMPKFPWCSLFGVVIGIAHQTSTAVWLWFILNVLGILRRFTAFTLFLGLMWPIRMLAFNIGEVDNRTHLPNSSSCSWGLECILQAEVNEGAMRRIARFAHLVEQMLQECLEAVHKPNDRSLRRRKNCWGRRPIYINALLHKTPDTRQGYG